MGVGVSLDAKPQELAEMLALEPTGRILQMARHRSKLKGWRFFATTDPLKVKSAALTPEGLLQLDFVAAARECFVLLHIYRRYSTSRKSPSATSPVQKGGGAAAIQEDRPAAAATLDKLSLLQLAKGLEGSLSPRGLASTFSGYEDDGPYPFERRETLRSTVPPLVPPQLLCGCASKYHVLDLG